MTHPTDDELKDLAHSAYEEAMSFGLSVDTFLRPLQGESMKVKTATLDGLGLRWAVAQALNYEVTTEGGYHEDAGRVVVYKLHGPAVPGRYAGDTEWAPDERWDQGGPILDQCDIATAPLPDGLWRAYAPDGVRQTCQGDKYVQTFNWAYRQEGYGKLVAGLRCFVLSRLGSEVDIPEELLPSPLTPEKEKK